MRYGGRLPSWVCVTGTPSGVKPLRISWVTIPSESIWWKRSSIRASFACSALLTRKAGSAGTPPAYSCTRL